MNNSHSLSPLPRPRGRTPRVLILYNEPVLPTDHPDAESEHEIYFTVEELSKEFKAAGVPHDRVGVQHDPSVLLKAVVRFKPEVIFNLYEGLATDPACEAHMAGLLEWLNLPFTGSPALTLSLCRNKHLAKQLLLGSGLPTPAFQTITALPLPELHLNWPVIVKPAGQDASVGVDQGAVVTSREQLEQRVEWVFENYGGPVLLEEYIQGREFSVALVEIPHLVPLPISEIQFRKAVAPGYWPIVTYDAKWHPESTDFALTPPNLSLNIPESLRDRLWETASQAFHAVGCRDYARVDIRVDENQQPFILEVNPNPDFSPVSGFSDSMQALGIEHSAFAIHLAHQARARVQGSPRLSSLAG